MKLVGLFDVDGVVADFKGASQPYLEKLLGKKLTDEDFKRWDVSHCLESNQELRKEFDKIVDSPGWCYSIDPYDGAREGIDLIRELGIEVVFVTSHRKTCPTWVHERDKWLKRHFDVHDDDIYHCHKKERVMGDFIVDDRPKNVENWGKKHVGKSAILWDQPYNKYADIENPGILRIGKWEDLKKFISSAFK